MKASIVIPCFNAEKYIDSCLEPLFNQSWDDFEILMVDDGSCDGTLDKLNKYRPRKNFRLLFNKKNLGSGSSRNVLIKESRGEIILLLDIDCIVGKDWISQHLKYQQQGYPIVGGAIEGIYQTFWGKIDDYSSWFTSIPSSGSYFVKGIHLPTTNLSIKRDVFEKVGYFREDIATGEDADWCYRAEMKQFRLFFTSHVIVKHFNRNELKDVLSHEKAFGKHAFKVRGKSKMPYHWAIPKNIYVASLLALPIAFCYAVKIVIQWHKKGHNVLAYFIPLFFIKIAYSLGLIFSCHREKGWRL